MKSLGVPYSEEQVQKAPQAAKEQSLQIALALAGDSPIKGLEDREIIALISYLQRLGKNPELFKKYEAAGGDK